jgi:hypothetical protein
MVKVLNSKNHTLLHDLKSLKREASPFLINSNSLVIKLLKYKVVPPDGVPFLWGVLEVNWDFHKIITTSRQITP